MEWCAFRNPYAKNEPTYFIAEDNEEIIAYMGRMPTEFIINGQRQKGYFNHDLYVHPKYREKGMGLFLSMSLFRANEENIESLFCSVFMLDLTVEMLRRRGYYQLKAGCYLKVLNPNEILKRLLGPTILAKILSPFLRGDVTLIDLIILKLIPSRRTLIKIDKFNSHFDNFYQPIFKKMGICSYKQSSYLNWKFIERPFSKVVVLAAKEKDQIMGYIILAPNLGKQYPEGMIVDIIADPQDKRTIVSLFKESINYFRQQKVFSIRCCLTDRRFIRILRTFIFLSLPRGEPVMLANLEKYEEKKYLMDIKNWHLTYSETDELMLRP